MSFPAYSAYKKSGIELLGEFPDHWMLKRFKNVFVERTERSTDGAEELLSVSAYFGIKPRSETLDEGDHLSRAESLEGYKVCRAGDLVINIMLAWNRGLGVSWQKGIVSPAYSVFHVTDGSSPKFLDYLVRSDEYITYFKTYSAGIMDSRLRLYPESFGRLFTAIPPVCEQIQIARFLDHETASIDALIEEQKRLIELLKEKRQAVISQAVTKGLNPMAPMKDSGVEWLGEVPVHWSVSPLKFLVEEKVAGPYGASLTKAMYTDSGYRVYGQQQVISDDFSVGDYYISEDKFSEMQRYVVFPGDVLISVMGTIGRVSVVPFGVEAGIINPRLVRYKFSPNKVIPEFAKILLMSFRYQNRLREESQGSTMEGLNMVILGDLPLVLPPLNIQQSIVAVVKDYDLEFDELVGQAQLAVELLQERRSALISAAVTGKIDVRGWQPPTSEPSPELVQEAL
jgi:type I restriction enzyme, S subunit